MQNKTARTRTVRLYPYDSVGLVCERHGAENMVDVATLSGTRVALDAGEISALGAVLRGKLLLPQDYDYRRARRVWNGNIDRYPTLRTRL